jgi:hypothetical protein
LGKSSFVESQFAKKFAYELKKILYLASFAVTALVLIACLASLSVAQRPRQERGEDRPEITPQDKVVNKKKKGADPRAVGLLQITSAGKATLVPIAILINGKFHDASSYKAAPVPMALESGTVYEGERTGSSLGLFTVNGALHSKAANVPDPWIGTGQWLLEGAETQKTTHKAETVPVGLETTDEPPRLTKSGKTQKDSSTDTTSTTAGSPTSTGSNPPILSKPADPNQSTPDKKTPDQSKPEQSTPSAQNAPASGKPDASKTDSSAAAKSDDAAPAPGEDTNSQAGDKNRPKLRRGKPTEPLPADEDVTGYAKPNAPAAVAEKKPDAAPGKADGKTDGKNDEGAAAKAPTQLIPAISDASGPDPRSYVFEWDKSEADERQKQVVALAQQQLHIYLQERAENSIVPKATPAKTAVITRKSLAKMPDLVLEDLQIRTFDLWANNQPVIVLTAKAHPPLPVVGSAAAANPVPEYTIALVARTDIYNNLHKLYVSVTDKFHLDMSPRLELIDAVDADGDGRGELLFRETSDAGSGYVIYRATADTLWKMFDSLSPE